MCGMLADRCYLCGLDMIMVPKRRGLINMAFGLSWMRRRNCVVEMAEAMGPTERQEGSPHSKILRSADSSGSFGASSLRE